MDYRIYIKHSDNSSYLSINGKTSWKIRTAKKHLKDAVTEKVQNKTKWGNVRYFALVAA